MAQNNNLLATIIDVFEDFLDEKGVHIPNADRDAEDSSNPANIWGMDFDDLMNGIRDTLNNYGIEVEDTWDDEDTTEYYIIPKDEIIMKICATNKEDAMIAFAGLMDSDMNTYFKAVTRDEYVILDMNKRRKICEQEMIDFYVSELENGFDEVDFSDINDVAANAYKIKCNAGSYSYCDIETDYDALNRAVEEYNANK